MTKISLCPWKIQPMVNGEKFVLDVHVWIMTKIVEKSVEAINNKLYDFYHCHSTFLLRQKSILSKLGISSPDDLHNL